MKKFLLFISVLFLLSCSEKTDTRQSADAIENNEVSQQSIVDTSFEGSMLYKQFREGRTEGPIIPGLLHQLVPQGMAFQEDENAMIISNYMSDDTAGTLTFISMDTGLFEKVLFLFNADNTPHTGHLGGLAVSRKYLWISSGPGVYNIPLETVFESENNGKITLPELIETETKGSFATYSDNILWIGEFTRANGSYPVPEYHHSIARDNNSHRAWLAGYKLSASDDMINLTNTYSSKVLPDYILSIPDEIQGAAFADNKILLSASYGRKNYSRLLLFDSPLNEAAHRIEEIFPDRNIPFWFLDDTNKTGQMTAPPMSEAAVVYKEKIAVLFESAASKYRSTASYPVDRIQYINIDSIVTVE